MLFGFALGVIFINAANPERKCIEERKIVEIDKIVKLTPKQKTVLTKGYKDYLAALDSSVYLVKDVVLAASIKYSASKAFHELFINTLKEPQLIKYVHVVFAPELEEKTTYNVSLLIESGEYSDSELGSLRKEIFKYLMLEKVVYFRDKYNVQKQKENISRLKNLQPKCLKESNIREKQKGQGRFKNGKVLW